MNHKLHNSKMSQVIQYHIQHPIPPPNPQKTKSPIFKNKSSWRCLVSSDITYITKYKPKMLSNIQLDLVDDKQIGNISLRKLRLALKDNKRTSSLTIKHHHSWLYQDTKGIDRLFTATNRWKTLKFFYNDQQFAQRHQELKDLTKLRRCKDLTQIEIMLNCSEESKNLILGSLSKQLRGLRHLKDLLIDISDCDRAEFMQNPDEHYDPNATLLTFRFPTSLSSLKIVFGGGYLHNDLFSKFTKNIHLCYSSLEHLHLDISRIYHNIEPIFENAWSSLFEKLQNLKIFTFNAYWYSEISNQGAQEFLKSLQYLKQITTLEFNFTFSPLGGLFEMFLCDLSLHLPSLSNLTSLNLSYSPLLLPQDLSNQNLFLDLKHLTQLQKLRFSCSYCSNFHMRNFAFALKHLENLTLFHFLLPQSYISDSELTSLAQSLHQLSRIQDLHLDFNCCHNLSDKSLEILSQAIAHLNPMSFNLKIGYPRTKSLLDQLVSYWKDQKEFSSFFSVLQKFTSLTNLSLNLSAFNINTKQFKGLSESLKDLKNLTSLILELPQFGSENNFEGFMTFGLILKELRKLTLFHLTTSKRAKLRDQEIILIFLSLKECKFLESLKLSFEFCQLTGQCLKHVLSEIKTLSLLKYVYLAFASEKKIKKEVILKLLEGLTVLKKLEKLELKYPRNFEPGFQATIENFTYHQRFRHLTNFALNETV